MAAAAAGGAVVCWAADDEADDVVADGAPAPLEKADCTAERNVLPNVCMTGRKSIGVPSPTCRETGWLAAPPYKQVVCRLRGTVHCCVA